MIARWRWCTAVVLVVGTTGCDAPTEPPSAPLRPSPAQPIARESHVEPAPPVQAARAPTEIPLPSDLDSVSEERVRDAVHAARRRVETYPGLPHVWAALGHVFTAHSWDPESVLCYREAVRLDNVDPRWQYYLGRSLLPSEPPAAAEAFARMLDEKPGYGPAHLFLARALRQTGDTEAAREHFARALELQPTNALAALGLGQLEAQAANYDLARTHLEHALALDPAQSDAHKELARVCMALGDRDAATTHALAGRSQRPVEALDDPLWRDVQSAGMTADWFAVRGAVLLRKRDFAGAVAEFEQAVSADQDDARFWLNYGIALVHTQEYAEAVRSFERALAVRPSHEAKQLTPEIEVELHVNLGIAQAQTGDIAAGERSLGRAMSLAPGSVDAANNLAVLYIKQERYGEAVALLEPVQARDPNPRTSELLRAARAAEPR